MAELLTIYSHREQALLPTVPYPAELALYCWPCRTVHSFNAADVEKIVYALSASEILNYSSGFDDGSSPGMEPTRLPEDPPTCLLTMLRHADDIEVFGEHVEQGVECRKAAE